MKLIVAVDKNWGIGRDNNLLFSIPEDMKFFRSTTLDKVVLMGRKTLESFPNGNPLKNRINIVLTNDKSYSKEGAVVVHSVEEIKEKIAEFNTDDVYVIGGASVYEMLYDYCDTAYVTKVYKDGNPDKFMVNLDEKDTWQLKSKSETKVTDEGIEFAFCTFVNSEVKNL